MKAFFKLFVAILGCAVIGVAGIYGDYAPGSRASVESHLLNKADAAARKAQADWADIEIDGQKAVLRGVAPSRDALEHARDAVLSAVWTGGLAAGGVTVVDISQVQIYDGPPIVDPFVWRVELGADRIDMSGYAPSQAARDAVYQLAAMRFPGKIINGDLALAGGAPPEEIWLGAASASLQALARTEEGAVLATGADFQISGVVRNEGRAAAVRQLMASISGSATGRADLTLLPAESNRFDADAPDEASDSPAIASSAEPFPTDATPGGQAENGAPPANSSENATPSNSEAEEVDADPSETAANEAASLNADSENQRAAAEARAAETEACRNDLTAQLAQTPITFASARTEINIESRRALDRLLAPLRRCPQFTLLIVGHTDSSGDAAANQALSQFRADAVAQYLRSSGVAARRIETRGAGQSEPLVSNNTPAGRAQNRRIEFDIRLADNE